MTDTSDRNLCFDYEKLFHDAREKNSGLDGDGFFLQIESRLLHAQSLEHV